MILSSSLVGIGGGGANKEFMSRRRLEPEFACLLHKKESLL